VKRHKTTVTYDPRGRWDVTCDSCSWKDGGNELSTTKYQMQTSGAIHESEKWSELMRWVLS